MSKTVVVYWSGTGNTQTMAEAVFEGAKEVNPQASLLAVSETTAAEVLEYDNLILGCPAMGSEELEEGEFEPFFSKISEGLTGKNVALFGSYGWGDGGWMRSWIERVSESGANLIEDEGLIINETPDDDGLELCKALGKKAASI